MARPLRRRPTLPDHDPRAIRAAVRREVYAVGDARRQLDEIEFRICEVPPDGDNYPSRLGLEVIVNGTSTVTHMERRPVPARLQWIPTETLREREGKRTAYFANCSCGLLECGRLRADVAVAGRYVLWSTAERHFGGPLVFDRASYRESLEAALAEVRATETPEEWALREVLDRGSWGVTGALGLRLYDARAHSGALALSFHDELWKTLVTIKLPWDGSDPEGTARLCLEALAKGDVGAWEVEWIPAFRDSTIRPPYPQTWRRRQLGVAMPRDV